MDAPRPAALGPAPKLDCTRCGACCCNTDTNRAEGFIDYVEVLPGDVLRRRPDLMGKLAVRNVARQIHLRLTPDGRCVALEGKLGQSVHCSIYDVRPTVCRRVQPGTEECLNARRERGVG
ncbi:MAG: YkgJ family cysteine cluster protein [Myxococcota bacterium]